MSGQPTELEVVAHADSPATLAALESIGRSIAGRLTNVQTTLQAVIELRASAGRSWPPPDRPPFSIRRRSSAFRLPGWETPSRSIPATSS